MKKIAILLIALMVISIGFLSGCNEKKTNENEQESNDDTPPDNVPTTYTVNIKLGTIPDSYFLQVHYSVYDNVQNWEYVDPILEKSDLTFESTRYFRTEYSFTVPADITYVIQIELICQCINCEPCYVPEDMVDESYFEPTKYFYGTFSSDETFTIQSTGYVTKSDGTLLTKSW